LRRREREKVSENLEMVEEEEVSIAFLLFVFQCIAFICIVCFVHVHVCVEKIQKSRKKKC
jgi:hypothetical protein